MRLKDILEELNKKTPLGKCEFDREGICHLMIEDKYLIHLQESSEEDVIHLFSKLAPIPAENPVYLFELLLESNLFGRGTGGAVLSIDIPSQGIFFSKELITEITDTSIFEKELELFIKGVEFWVHNIEDPPKSGTSQSEEHYYSHSKHHSPDLKKAIESTPQNWLKI